jgi:hypothetical protein
MKTTTIPGDAKVKLLQPETKTERRNVAALVTQGKVDAGMDVNVALKEMQKEKS